jgi:AcrR family transcriptional regulator
MAITTRVPRAERSERVRAALLAAARDQFLEHGYHGASLDQIAAAAGFTKGVVYSRFASKADLFLALLEERIEARAAQNLELAAQEAGAGLPGLARRWNQVQREDLPWSLLVLEFRVHAARDPELNARYAALHERTLAGIAGIVEQTGAATGDEARRLARAIFTMGNGAVLEQAVDGRSMDDEQVIEHVTRLQRGLG